MRRVGCGAGAGEGKAWVAERGGLGLETKVPGGEDIHCFFLSLAPLTIWAGSFLVCGGGAVLCIVRFLRNHFQVCSSIPGLYSLDTSDAHPPKKL